jgi:hypothetical protein
MPSKVVGITYETLREFLKVIFNRVRLQIKMRTLSHHELKPAPNVNWLVSANQPQTVNEESYCGEWSRIWHEREGPGWPMILH